MTDPSAFDPREPDSIDLSAQALPPGLVDPAASDFFGLPDRSTVGRDETSVETWRAISRDLAVVGFQAVRLAQDDPSRGDDDAVLLSNDGHPGDPAAAIDAVALEAIEDRARILAPRAWVIGEEGWPKTKKVRPLDSLIVVDPVDGTKPARCLLFGWASVVLVLVKARSQGYRFVAGSIAYSTGHVHSFVNRHGDVRWGMAWTPAANDAPVGAITPSAGVWAGATVGASPSRSAAFDEIRDRLGFDNLWNTGGVPAFEGLIRGELSVVVDTQPSMPCDAAGLLPLLALGGGMATLSDARTVQFEDLLRLIGSGEPVAKCIPPYVAAKTPDVARRVAMELRGL